MCVCVGGGGGYCFWLFFFPKGPPLFNHKTWDLTKKWFALQITCMFWRPFSPWRQQQYKHGNIDSFMSKINCKISGEVLRLRTWSRIWNFKIGSDKIYEENWRVNRSDILYLVYFMNYNQLCNKTFRERIFPFCTSLGIIGIKSLS